MRIVTVVGARPQFVKAAVVSKALAGAAEEFVIHTGQHYDKDMSDLFFEELEMHPPNVNLGVGSGTPGFQTARMLEGIERVLQRSPPNFVLLYGDTNSTIAGALAAAKLHIPVAHVEAGLRSFNRLMPEEINRIVTDHVSDLLFAPTAAAERNLLMEGCSRDAIHVVGDVMYDAALQYAEVASRRTNFTHAHAMQKGDYVLATIHRAENTDNIHRLRSIFEGLASVAKHLPVVLPLHPRTAAVLEREQLLKDVNEEIHIIPPVGYLEMIALERNARLIATDSGGVQKEAFFHQVPCVTLRNETEWVELVEAGWNSLCPPVSAEAVRDAVLRALTAPKGADVAPYGSGDAAKRIAMILKGACE